MMTAYLNQTATYATLLDPEVSVDLYGNAEYAEEIIIPCRREVASKEVADNAGKLVHSTLTYFLDAGVHPLESEKLDGRLILAVEEYVDGSGVRVGWEVYT